MLLGRPRVSFLFERGVDGVCTDGIAFLRGQREVAGGECAHVLLVGGGEGIFVVERHRCCRVSWRLLRSDELRGSMVNISSCVCAGSDFAGADVI